MSIWSDAVKIAYPGSVQKSDGAPFTRPKWTCDRIVYDEGYYWENLDGDRFYFDTFEEAAEDIAIDMGMKKDEALEILSAAEMIT